MTKVIYASVLSLLLLAGCGNKVDGTYAIDINATKATAEFQAENQKTRGGATMGLQLFSQLAGTLTIEGSKFRLVTLDCKLNSDLTKAECTDVNSPSTPAKALGFSFADGIIKFNAGEDYPIVYRSTKSSGGTSQVSAAPVAPKAFDKFEGVWLFSTDKSKAANTKLDEMQEAIFNGILMATAINTSNSAGMKITGGQLQDGNNFCSFEDEADKEGLVSCVVQSDRSIYGKFMISPEGDLLLKGVGGIESAFLVFERKK